MGLFQPVWMTENARKLEQAKNAVGKVREEDRLYEIATSAPLPAIRRAAVWRIKDQRRLYQLAATQNSGTYGEVGLQAIQNITDEALLEKLAFELTGYPQQEVVRRISNENVLVKILQETKDSYTANAALDRLHSQNAYARVVLSKASENIRERIVTYRLTDQAVLRALARDETNENIRREAVIQLTDPALLAEYADIIADYQGDRQKACAAVARIRDAMALLVIASRTCFDRVQAQCLEKLNQPDSCSNSRLDAEKILEIIRECGDNRVRAAAAARLESLGGSAQSGESARTILQAKLVEAADRGRMEELSVNPEASLEALSGEFRKFIDGFTKERRHIFFDDHFQSDDLKEMDYYARIAAGLSFLHSQCGMAEQVEARFPEKSYTCDYEWWETGDNGSRIECDGRRTLAVWR